MKKQIFMLSLLAFALMISIISVSANGVYSTNGITFQKPVAYANLSGNAILNVTNVTTLFNNLLNCSFYAKSTSTNNNTWTLIGTFSNNTNYNVNGTFVSTILEDSNDYLFNATCINSSNDITYNVITGITIDNTIPQAPVLTPITGTTISSSSNQNFYGNVVDANTTRCTYMISSGTTFANGNATYSGNTCSFNYQFNSGNKGTWIWNITSSDGTNTSTSTNNFINANSIAYGNNPCPLAAYPCPDGIHFVSDVLINSNCIMQTCPNNNSGIICPESYHVENNQCIPNQTSNNNLIFFIIVIVLVIIGIIIGVRMKK